MVSESSVEKKQKANLGRNDSSSSSSTDENDFRRPVHKKFHLFGRHKSLHAALGGGKRTFPKLVFLLDHVHYLVFNLNGPLKFESTVCFSPIYIILS